jgi:hypothetical protein
LPNDTFNAVTDYGKGVGVHSIKAFQASFDIPNHVCTLDFPYPPLWIALLASSNSLSDSFHEVSSRPPLPSLESLSIVDCFSCLPEVILGNDT